MIDQNHPKTKQKYGRVFNFSAGPSTLPLEVLEEVRNQILNWKGIGFGVMEMSHRSKEFEGILVQTESDLRQLMDIPKEYKVLFLQGGASLQFSMVPMNLLSKGSVADYIVTGAWSQKAVESARLAGHVHTVFDGVSTGYDFVPELQTLSFDEDPAYVHVTSNETLHGLQFPKDIDLPYRVVCDMSSDILARPVDVQKYSLIYAGAQKNMGPAGVTVVIIKEDLLEFIPKQGQPILSYHEQVENRSLFNTPPCWSIYICGLVYQWLLKQGGVSEIYKLNQDKASLIYNAIDHSNGFYKGHAQKNSRSLMNITFTLQDEDLTDRFIKEAAVEGFDGFKGHRSLGGCRVSIYNAFPKEGCVQFADFMRQFALKNG